ncbi:hypothetical protein ACJQWK_02248 [Exserohilum turcicum]
MKLSACFTILALASTSFGYTCSPPAENSAAFGRCNIGINQWLLCTQTNPCSKQGKTCQRIAGVDFAASCS